MDGRKTNDGGRAGGGGDIASGFPCRKIFFMRIRSGRTVASTDLRSCFFLLCIFLTLACGALSICSILRFFHFHMMILQLFLLIFFFFQTTRNCNCIVRDAIFRVPTSLFLILNNIRCVPCIGISINPIKSIRGKVISRQ